ncbi:enoyl-CoA hydratase/isomerase family protein [Skermania piniformis]|uniref:Enoyl-CoA hydratase/isomerase family protein n=1 Tax=Skermania pinensis TaxID=39122 RepID=A0ABX8SBL9_9ACTN|nr:enoyl-CoA hydratase/isomerase family protein [Skermania piniformis]QXQ15263.1 enoyl-CoA hydratase/isomerase family protein [Skermania piniformis]
MITVRLDELVTDVGDVRHHPLVLIDLDGVRWPHSSASIRLLRRTPVVLVGIASAPLPDAAAPLLGALDCTLAPAGPGRTWARATTADVAAIRATVAGAPSAAVALVDLLRITAAASVRDALAAESFAYSMLLAGGEFATWRATRPRSPIPVTAEPVLVERADDELVVRLNRPHRRNAFDRSIRDGLVDALALAEIDPSIRRVVLCGNGVSFSSGGDLDEFGTAEDVSRAHLIRMQQSAGYAVHRIADRVHAHLHGACIGAGIEVPAFAHRVVCRSDTWFQLPELSMGLVPGAGGTVGIPRRIGRWRTAFLALTGRPIDSATALDWGLVDAGE